MTAHLAINLSFIAVAVTGLIVIGRSLFGARGRS